MKNHRILEPSPPGTHGRVRTLLRGLRIIDTRFGFALEATALGGGSLELILLGQQLIEADPTPQVRVSAFIKPALHIPEGESALLDSGRLSDLFRRWGYGIATPSLAAKGLTALSLLTIQLDGPLVRCTLTIEGERAGYVGTTAFLLAPGLNQFLAPT